MLSLQKLIFIVIVALTAVTGIQIFTDMSGSTGDRVGGLFGPLASGIEGLRASVPIIGSDPSGGGGLNQQQTDSQPYLTRLCDYRDSGGNQEIRWTIKNPLSDPVDLTVEFVPQKPVDNDAMIESVPVRSFSGGAKIDESFEWPDATGEPGSPPVIDGFIVLIHRINDPYTYGEPVNSVNVEEDALTPGNDPDSLPNKECVTGSVTTTTATGGE